MIGGRGRDGSSDTADGAGAGGAAVDAAGRGEGAIASALGMKPPAVQRALLEELTKEQEKESGGG